MSPPPRRWKSTACRRSIASTTAPSQEKLYAFSDYLRTIGIKFAKGQVVKPGTFNRILAQMKDGPHEAVMNDVVLRTQSQAVYAPDNLGHFGLNLARYAHFTSPIRRYADLVVHRALIRALKLGEGGLSDKEIGAPGRDRRTHLHDRAPRHGGRARFQRPLCRRLHGRSRRRQLPGAHHRRHPLRPVRAAGRDRRRGPDPGALARLRIFPARREEARHDRRPHRHHLSPRRPADRAPSRSRSAHRRPALRSPGRR